MDITIRTLRKIDAELANIFNKLSLEENDSLNYQNLLMELLRKYIFISRLLKSNNDYKIQYADMESIKTLLDSNNLISLRIK